MESRENFYFDDSDNPGSDDMIEITVHAVLRKCMSSLTGISVR